MKIPRAQMTIDVISAHFGCCGGRCRPLSPRTQQENPPLAFGAREGFVIVVVTQKERINKVI